MGSPGRRAAGRRRWSAAPRGAPRRRRRDLEAAGGQGGGSPPRRGRPAVGDEAAARTRAGAGRADRVHPARDVGRAVQDPEGPWPPRLDLVVRLSTMPRPHGPPAGFREQHLHGADEKQAGVDRGEPVLHGVYEAREHHRCLLFVGRSRCGGRGGRPVTFESVCRGPAVRWCDGHLVGAWRSRARGRRLRRCPLLHLTKASTHAAISASIAKGRHDPSLRCLKAQPTGTRAQCGRAAGKFCQRIGKQVIPGFCRKRRGKKYK